MLCIRGIGRLCPVNCRLGLEPAMCRACTYTRCCSQNIKVCMFLRRAWQT